MVMSAMVWLSPESDPVESVSTISTVSGGRLMGEAR
jgi:hypothetical protein